MATAKTPGKPATTAAKTKAKTKAKPSSRTAKKGVTAMTTQHTPADAAEYHPPSDLTPTLVFGKAGVTPTEARPRLPKMGRLESVQVTWLWPKEPTTDTIGRPVLDRLGQWSDLLRYIEASTVVNGVGCRGSMPPRAWRVPVHLCRGGRLAEAISAVLG